jgi:SNF2-related domain
VPELHKYQHTAIEKLEAGARYLAAVPGSGKTAIAIHYALRRRCRRVLVIAPASALGVWTGEVAKWSEERAVLIGKASITDQMFLVTSYDLIVRNQRVRELIEAQEFDLGVVDEAHMGKSHDAARTMRLFGSQCCGGGLLDRCQEVILLSGTPTPNGWCSELWPALRYFGVVEEGYIAFARRHCVFDKRRIRTPRGDRLSDVIVSNNQQTLPALKEKIRPLFWRPPVHEIEAELPSMRWAVRHLAPGMVDSKAIRELEDSPEAEVLREAIAVAI